MKFLAFNSAEQPPVRKFAVATVVLLLALLCMAALVFFYRAAQPSSPPDINDILVPVCMHTGVEVDVIFPPVFDV